MALSEMTVERGKNEMRTAKSSGPMRMAALGAMAACALGTTTKAQASGFELREGSTDWMATAFAGDTAKAYDASTAWSNPAGMVRLDQSEIDGSINGIFPSTSFSGANFVGPGVTTSGTTSGNLIESAATAGVYAVWSVTPDFKLGFGAGSPFDQRMDNPGTFVGRYQSLVSSITDEQFTISGAYKINEQWSIGGGPVIDFFSARLTQAINIGPASAVTGDPDADLHGDDTAAGFNLGLLYQPTPDLRFGLDYRSRIQHNISGSQSIYVPPLLSLLSPATAAALNAQNSAASTSITLPDSVTGGVYWQATPQLALLSDISWTDWSLLQSINITPTSPLAAPTTIMENWRNTVAVSVGANYNLTKALMLQGGVGFDQSPVTESTRTSRIPDSNRYLINIGAQYEVLPNLTLQVAYSHIFFDSAELTSQASTTSGVLVGKYTSSADTASLGVKYRF
jgi:long-chain fatty acid transport protein